MDIRQCNNVHFTGEGAATMVFAQGFGCDQNMWRLLAPAFASRYQTIQFDLVGSGASDLSAYDRQKYDSLQGGSRIFHQTHWAPLLQMQDSVSEVKLDVMHRVGHTIKLAAAALNA